MFESGWCYGWREDEILSLRVRQFDPIARTILLEPGETKNDIPRQTPPMDETIFQLILACVADKGPDDFIFTRDDGEPIKDFRGAWWKACVAAGVGKFVCRVCLASAGNGESVHPLRPERERSAAHVVAGKNTTACYSMISGELASEI
jgi:integrase